MELLFLLPSVNSSIKLELQESKCCATARDDISLDILRRTLGSLDCFKSLSSPVQLSSSL